MPHGVAGYAGEPCDLYRPDAGLTRRQDLSKPLGPVGGEFLGQFGAFRAELGQSACVVGHGDMIA